MKVGKVNRYFILSGLAIVSASILILIFFNKTNKGLELFQDLSSNQEPSGNLNESGSKSNNQEPSGNSNESNNQELSGNPNESNNQESSGNSNESNNQELSDNPNESNNQESSGNPNESNNQEPSGNLNVPGPESNNQEPNSNSNVPGPESNNLESSDNLNVPGPELGGNNQEPSGNLNVPGPESTEVEEETLVSLKFDGNLEDLDKNREQELKDSIKSFVQRKGVIVNNITLREGSIIADVEVSKETDKNKLIESIEIDINTGNTTIENYTLKEVSTTTKTELSSNNNKSEPTINSSNDIKNNGVPDTTTENEKKFVTVMSIKPKRGISLVQGRVQIISILDSFNINHLSSAKSVLRTIDDNSINMYSVQHDLALVVEILNNLENKNDKNDNSSNNPEFTELSQTIEYTALRDNLIYVFGDFKTEDYSKMLNLFSMMYNITPIENKDSLLKNILFEVDKRLLLKQKVLEMSKNKNNQRLILKKENEDILNSIEESTTVDEKLDDFLKDRNPESFEELFNKIEPQDMVYNVGVPIQDYMTQIIRPQDWTKALTPPSCLRDSTQINEPVAILDRGIPSNVHKFNGVGTVLPKFAYTEAYDPKYY